MAAFNHFYGEELDAQSDGSGSFVALQTITASGQLVANTKYLIVARGLWNGDNANSLFHMQVATADDATIAAKSESIIEPDVTGTDRGQFYFFDHSFITDDTPADIILQHKAPANNVQADQLSIGVLDLDDISSANLINTYHFDASDAGPTDSGADWNNDANAFDGSSSTFADKNGAGTGSLTGEGTTAPTSGAAIGEVALRVTVEKVGGGTGDMNIIIDEDSVGGTNLFTLNIANQEAKKVFDGLITPPSGGWTWQKINDLALSIDAGVDQNSRVFIAEVKVYDSNGRGYLETVNDDDASQYPTTQAAEWTIPGADLGTDEWLILAYQRTGDINTGRNFRVEAHAAVDTSTTAVRAKDENEGEDTAELRMSGFALRHQASSGTPNFEMQTWTEFNNAFQDRGGYGIALKASNFVAGGFKAEYTAGSTSIDGTERTFETITSYSPSVTADHWLFGLWNQTLTTNTPIVEMHIEDDDVEMRVGDQAIDMSCDYDATATPQLGLFYQDNILSSDTSTYTLRGTSGASTDSVEHRWLIILSLEKAAVAAAPVVRRRQLTTVRM